MEKDLSISEKISKLKLVTEVYKNQKDKEPELFDLLNNCWNQYALPYHELININDIFFDAIFENQYYLDLTCGGPTEEGYDSKYLIFSKKANSKELEVIFGTRGIDCDGGYGHETTYHYNIDFDTGGSLNDFIKLNTTHYDEYAERAGY